MLVGVAGMAYAWYPPFRLFTWVAVGRSPDCPLTQAIQSNRNEQIERESSERIIKQSKLVSLDGEGLELWETPQGRFWIPRSGRNLLAFYLAARQQTLCGAGDICLDWGAQSGVNVNGELLAGAARIVAVDAAADHIECLRRNFSGEVAMGRVIVVAADSSSTIDQVVADLKLPRVDYIRVDAAGGEPKALSSARQTISRFKPRISVTTYHRSSNPRLVEQTIRGIRPDYQVRCGPCFALKDAHSIRPDVLYFK